MGSADHNVHLYDLRKADAPTHVFSGEHSQWIITLIRARAHPSAAIHSSLPLELATQRPLSCGIQTGHQEERLIVRLS